MANPYGANRYKQTAVTTANRGDVLIMLYEAAIRNVTKAIDAIDNDRVAEKGEAIGKAHDIINELLNSLDFNVGGEVAQNLEQLYNFMTEQLITANMENQREPLDSVKEMLEELLDGWREAVKQVNENST